MGQIPLQFLPAGIITSEQLAGVIIYSQASSSEVPGAFPSSRVCLSVQAASQPLGFSWLRHPLNSDAGECSCQGYRGHLSM